MAGQPRQAQPPATSARAVSPEVVTRLLHLRDAHHTCPTPANCDPPWCMMACDKVALEVAAVFGWRWVAGFYTGPEVAALDLVEGARFAHIWNALPDGTIVDASNNQFGEHGFVRIIGPQDPRARWYLPDARVRAMLT